MEKTTFGSHCCVIWINLTHTFNSLTDYCEHIFITVARKEIMISKKKLGKYLRFNLCLN